MPVTSFQKLSVYALSVLSFTCPHRIKLALCGSEDQKWKYLPSLAELSTVACWVSDLILPICYMDHTHLYIL